MLCSLQVKLLFVGSPENFVVSPIYCPEYIKLPSPEPTKQAKALQQQQSKNLLGINDPLFIKIFMY